VRDSRGENEYLRGKHGEKSTQPTKLQVLLGCGAPALATAIIPFRRVCAPDSHEMVVNLFFLMSIRSANVGDRDCYGDLIHCYPKEISRRFREPLS